MTILGECILSTRHSYIASLISYIPIRPARLSVFSSWLTDSLLLTFVWIAFTGPTLVTQELIHPTAADHRKHPRQCEPQLCWDILVNLDVQDWRFLSSYRHAAPSGPWPWVDLESDIKPPETEPASPQRQSTEGNNCHWRGYPQCLFGNWIKERVKRCKMVENCSTDASEQCRIYYVDVLKNGKFKPASNDNLPLDVDERNLAHLWDKLQTKVRNSCIGCRRLSQSSVSTANRSSSQGVAHR